MSLTEKRYLHVLLTLTSVYTGTVRRLESIWEFKFFVMFRVGFCWFFLFFFKSVYTSVLMLLVGSLANII